MTRFGPGHWEWNLFLQLLKIVAARRWGTDPSAVFESPGIGHEPPLDAIADRSYRRTGE